MGTFDRIKTYYNNYPLHTILWVALIIRLLAAFFSKGYAFHDDHFCVVRVAQNWVSGYPHWLHMDGPPKHSMLYAAFNAAFIWLMDMIHITDPIAKTTVLRIVHAFYSLLTIYFGFKIVNRLSNLENAKRAGWILTIIWFMPFLSVKFLAELVCVPLVLGGFYYLIKAYQQQIKSALPYLIAGALFGLAFTIRLHTILLAGGLGLVLLFRKQWLQAVYFTLGYLIVASLIVGVTDAVLFDYPFHSIISYFEYNSNNAYNYIKGSPFKFTFTTLGFLVPPVSLMLVFGYLRSFKVEPMMFVGAAVFFVFHSSFPNQQERFILPVLPIFILLGVIGWNNFYKSSNFWQGHQKLHRGLWYFFWTVNLIAALALTFTFSKRDRIEPLYYLSKQSDVKSVIIENERSVKQPPVYYLGSFCSEYHEFQTDILGLDKFKADKKYLDPSYQMVFTLGADKTIERLQFEMDSVNKHPNYVILQGKNRIEERKKRIYELFPGKELELVKTVSPSNFDKLLHFLNPKVHRDQTGFIYKVKP